MKRLIRRQTAYDRQLKSMARADQRKLDRKLANILDSSEPLTSRTHDDTHNQQPNPLTRQQWNAYTIGRELV